MNKLSIALSSIILSTSIAFAGTAGNFYNDEPLRLINMPVAGSLDTEDWATRNYVFGDGTLLTELYYSAYDDLEIGLSMTMNQFLGKQDIVIQDYPGVFIAYRIFDETRELPAIKLGFDSQGRGRWNKDNEASQQASPGLFMALSKQFESPLGGAGLHGGVGWSFHPLPEYRGWNIWIGGETAIWNWFSGAIEYTRIIESEFYTDRYPDGNLSVSLSASVSHNITLSIAVMNLINSTSQTSERTLIFEYRL